MAWSLKVKGIEDVRGRLRDLAKRGQDQTPVWSLAGEELATDGESRIVLAGLVDTGKMARSVRFAVRPLGVRVWVDMFYARYQHYGTKHVRKRPLLRLDKRAKLRVLNLLRRWLLAPWRGRQVTA